MNLSCLKNTKKQIRKMRWYVKDVVKSFEMLWRFRKVVWNYRHWDYAFQLDVIEQMLLECERKWVVETIYVGDTFTLGRIRVLLKNLNEYRSYSHVVGEGKLLNKFLRRYARTLPRLWD